MAQKELDKLFELDKALKQAKADGKCGKPDTAGHLRRVICDV
jgi:hypothetical protein